MKKKLSIATLVLFPFTASLLLIWSSCEDQFNQPGPSNVVFPDSGVSYSQHVEELFQQSCVSGQCHGGSTPGAGLKLERPSYGTLMDHIPRLVVSQEAHNSLLIKRLDGTVGDRMPLRGEALNTNQLEGIKRWINEGAVNN